MNILSNQEKQDKTAETISAILDNTGLSMSKFGKLLTLPGEEPIKRQTVYDWKNGKSKPSTDRLLDIATQSTDIQAVHIARKILVAIWPGLLI